MKKRNYKNYLRYVAVIGLLIFLYALGLLRPIEGAVAKVLNPIMRKIHKLSTEIKMTYNVQTSKKDLYEEIAKLKEQNELLAVENARFKTVAEENDILREHLGFLTRKEYKYIISNVIARGEITSETERTETLIIDRGSDDGIFPGLGVVSNKGVIVGKVQEVKSESSIVYLTNNNNCKLAASILGQAGTSGVTQGELGLTIRVDFIPQDKPVKIGDVLATSGLEQYIPRGLIIGKIIEVEKDSNELWQSVILEPEINPEDLIIVSVLIP